MLINFLSTDMILKMFSNRLNLKSHFFDEKLGSLRLLTIFFIELDNVWIIEVANFLKTSLEYISPDIFVDFYELFELLQDQRTYFDNINLIKELT